MLPIASMSIFPWRTVQRALDAIAPRLTVGGAKHLLNELRNPRKRLAAEWRVAGRDAALSPVELPSLVEDAA